jgi:imidazole glycerol-phosphate synthase subunit HisH
MSVAIVRYNAGNVRSVGNALERIGVTYTITDDAQELQSADRVIFPGVGEARSAMEYLRSSGLDVVLQGLKQPVLGVCLGMQLLCEDSEEGEAQCLGIIAGQAKRFREAEKIPHMGWSQVTDLKHPIFSGITEGTFFYFVHSYRVDECQDTVARCVYGERFSAAVGLGNFVGVQFHPEKSAEAGERVLKNFMEWRI